MATSRRDNRQEQELRAIIDDIPGNDKCADCEAVSPRWASYSLGVFLCTRCASIHRKNSDISKVKSISLDTWTPDQVQKMREVGNTISNYKFNPLREWPLQDDDQTMERFIRDKYERHMFMSQRETANFTPVKSAMKGSAKPIEADRSSSAVIKYSKELDQLREMGFTDRNKNLDVLKQVMGDMTSATDVLVSMASQGPQAAPPKKPQKLRVRFTADTIGGEEQTPQVQAANPFDMWAQTNSNQQSQNPFSSIPPSMYNNQNFVQNVQTQGQQQSAPFMGYQTTGEDAIQQQYIQPAVPLRSQLTGGQPLRPQLNQQQQLPPPAQEQMQPLRHQLTGRPAPPPPDVEFSAFQGQSAQFQPQQQQQPALHPQQAQYSMQHQQGQARQAETQAQMSQQNRLEPSYTPQNQQGSQQQANQAYQTAFQPHDPYSSIRQHNMNDTQQGQNLFRPPSTQPAQTLTPQLTGLRPKFQPTVDLNAPFGLNANPAHVQNQSPQRTGQSQLPASNMFSQTTGQPQRASPQVTGQLHLAQFGQQPNNRFQSASPQVTGQSANVGQESFSYRRSDQGLGTQSSGSQQAFQAGPNSAMSTVSDPFGTNFTAPLRAQLTGMLTPSQPYAGQSSTPQVSSFPSRPFQPLNNQFPGSNNASQPQTANSQFTSSTIGAAQQLRPSQQQSQASSQPLFAQNTGSRPHQIFPQTTGGQGFNSKMQHQYQPAQNAFNQQPLFQQQQTGNYGQQAQPQPPQQYQQQQQQYDRPFQPQATGYQQNQSQQLSQAQYGSNPGINPARPFDKAGIMSLYGMQQPQQYQQQQQQHQMPTGQMTQQGYNSNGYVQQNGYGQQGQQQGYNGYQ